MKTQRGPLLLSVLVLAAFPAAAETVPSLGEVPAHLRTPEAKAQFNQQINGAPAPDRLGLRALPPGLTAAGIAKLLVPADDHALAIAGARLWHDDLYLAIACTGAAAPSPDQPTCSAANASAALHAYLGVITLAPGTTPRLVASSGAWNQAVDWNATSLPDAPDGEDASALAPESFDGFDLAPYELSPGQRAFGLRAGWTESYSGGGASFSALYLFTIEGSRLVRVLAAPMSSFKDIAGDWHKDGTRDHDISEGANLVVISSHQTAGRFDLELRQRQGKSHQSWRWSAAEAAYRPVSK
jgi:hypothetical protein